MYKKRQLRDIIYHYGLADSIQSTVKPSKIIDTVLSEKWAACSKLLYEIEALLDVEEENVNNDKSYILSFYPNAKVVFHDKPSAYHQYLIVSDGSYCGGGNDEDSAWRNARIHTEAYQNFLAKQKDSSNEV